MLFLRFFFLGFNSLIILYFSVTLEFILFGVHLEFLKMCRLAIVSSSILYAPLSSSSSSGSLILRVLVCLMLSTGLLGCFHLSLFVFSFYSVWIILPIFMVIYSFTYWNFMLTPLKFSEFFTLVIVLFSFVNYIWFFFVWFLYIYWYFLFIDNTVFLVFFSFCLWFLLGLWHIYDSWFF